MFPWRVGEEERRRTQDDHRRRPGDQETGPQDQDHRTTGPGRQDDKTPHTVTVEHVPPPEWRGIPFA